MNYEIGSRVADYEILDILGAGGMGRVYKVKNILSERTEAMKVLLPDLEGTPGFADRFMREIKVQASLDHPNIAALHTAVRVDEQVLMLMEYVEGVTLEKVMETERVPIDKAVDFIVQVLSALSYAHARGVIHRDLKPANMMVTPSGLVKLMDFGIARMTADHKLTQTGSTVGSLYYMSPEQINGTTELDPRSDLYSLGVTLYEIVTGARPFQGDSGYKIMAAHLENKPSPPIQKAPGLPGGLSEIIMQALEKDPARRFQSADAFRAALLFVCSPGQAAMGIPASATTVKPQAAVGPVPAVNPPPVSRTATAHRGLWISMGALIVVAVIVVAAMQLPRFRRTVAGERTVQESQITRPAGVSQTSQSTPGLDSAKSNAQDPIAAAKEAEIPQSSGTIASAQKVTPVSPDKSSQAPVRADRSTVPAKSTKSVREPLRTETVQSSQPPAASDDGAMREEQLKEIRRQMDYLNMRMETVKDALQSLRRQQEASGLGLRADIKNSAQRMEYYFKQTETSLNSGDAESATKNLDLAEREVSKLENFLGK
jgi:eukaryotic-like serine/threonine-protein kinase